MAAKDIAVKESDFWTPFADLPFAMDWFSDLSPERLLRVNHHPIKIEEYVKNNEIVIRVELPGIDPDKDVHVQVGDGYLTVSGQREEHSKDEKRSEFYYGSFTRTIPLPSGTSENGVKAKYKDGILEVRVPQPKSVNNTKRIMIEKG